MTLVCIRQPGYLPFIGFFKKIQSSDVFVYLDDAQYTVGGWENRNKIKTSTGPIWLTVPVLHPFQQKLRDVKIKPDNWRKKHMLSIKNSYLKAPFFNEYWNDIEKILNIEWEKLIDLNFAFIEYFNSKLGLTTKTFRSSELDVDDKGSLRLLKICQKLNADVYMSGIRGKEYLDEKLFTDAGIKIIYENFQHPVYHQLHGEFIPNMAIVDLLFNEGDKSKEIIQNSINI